MRVSSSLLTKLLRARSRFPGKHEGQFFTLDKITSSVQQVSSESKRESDKKSTMMLKASGGGQICQECRTDPLPVRIILYSGSQLGPHPARRHFYYGLIYNRRIAMAENLRLDGQDYI